MHSRELVANMVSVAESDPVRAVAFQGAPGAYSHQACREIFPDGAYLPSFSFQDALAAVTEGRAAQAVIPIENSLHGRVADIHFLLPESGLSIVAEHFLRVRHCLLGIKGARRSDIRSVMSHPQALGQCRKHLRGWNIEPVAYIDTAAAAALVAEENNPSVGAVASRLSAELYGLDVLEEGIEDEDHNTTRFVVLARMPSTPPRDHGPVMTSLIFEVKNVPAALYKALGGFATNGINLTKLESYIRGGSFAAAEFYVEIVGCPQDENVARALDELAFHSKWVRNLGTYVQARERTSLP